MTLFGKVAIVTGASRNIGKSVAVALARSGADIGFVYRANTQTADETAREIRTLGRRVVYAQVDVMDWKASHAFVERVAKELGRVDILVSNAGNPSSVRAPLAEQDPEEMDLQFRTHVMGALHF
ncbi:MAG: SDR family NAD(P)-dependent oxidoreductase, partial [Deltaproteobacteria bacterium]|nr:SDR family NAD(P)-dependent oxidoreductase [Deltaproteobacteria bacterium]